MKKNIFATALLVFSGALAAIAGQIETRGIPADAAGVAQANVGDLFKSSLLQNATARAARFFREIEQETENDLWRAWGVSDPFKKITSVTVGFKVVKDTRGPEAVIFIARGNFVPSEILEALTQQRCKHSKLGAAGTRANIGKYSFVTIDEGRSLAGVYDANTIILIIEQDAVANLATAKAVLAALEGSSKSYVLPSMPVGQDWKIARPFFSFHVKFSSWKVNAPLHFVFPPTMPKPRDLRMAFGEDGSVFKFRLVMGYDTAAKAREAQSSVKALISEMLVRKSSDGKLHPMIKLLWAIKVDASGENFTITVDYPIAEIYKDFDNN
ncbi:MAG: hypothetical protein LBD14_03755 [Puniceicoccales bacterium]|jgi:hypothetical protein|nr:hypothetical protein [Puniceicoccales bacterium]